jgi:hypothetical protein
MMKRKTKVEEREIDEEREKRSREQKIKSLS